MKGYTGVLPSGEAILYVDSKRWWWMLAVLYPLQVLVPLSLHALTGNELWFVLPFFINFVVLPILDHVIGEDECNPPEEVVMQLDTGNAKHGGNDRDVHAALALASEQSLLPHVAGVDDPEKEQHAAGDQGQSTAFGAASTQQQRGDDEQHRRDRVR